MAEAPLPDLDSSSLPHGSRGWTRFVEALQRVDDAAEAHWLEMKSELEFNRSGVAKIAKFVLGAANRMPDVAARHLEGYAVMVLGVQQGATAGVPRVEDKDLENLLAPFLGVTGPNWETQRVAVSSVRDVLIVVVDPPKWGDPVYVCRREGDGVYDGDVYVRAKGETRRAKSSEFDRLQDRARAGTTSIELEVQVEGVVRAYTCDPTKFEAYIAATADDLRNALPSRRKMTPNASSATASQLAQIEKSFTASLGNVFAGLSAPETRSEDEFMAEVEAWQTSARGSLARVVDGIVAHYAPAVTFTVFNRTKLFLVDVKVTVHLDGDVEFLDKEDPEDLVVLDPVPRAPDAWGPKMTNFDHLGISFPSPFNPSSIRPAGGPSAAYENSGSVTITFTIPTLRPLDSQSFGEEVVLILRDPKTTTLTGTWRATAGGIHDVFTGEVSVPISGPVDVSEVVDRAVGADYGDEPDDDDEPDDGADQT